MGIPIRVSRRDVVRAWACNRILAQQLQQGDDLVERRSNGHHDLIGSRGRRQIRAGFDHTGTTAITVFFTCVSMGVASRGMVAGMH